MLSVTRHKNDKNDDMSNHLKWKHPHSSHICKVKNKIKVFWREKKTLLLFNFTVRF